MSFVRPEIWKSAEEEFDATPIGTVVEQVQKVLGEPILLKFVGKYAMSRPALIWGPMQRSLLRLFYVLIVGLRSHWFTDQEIMDWFVQKDEQFMGGRTPMGWIEEYGSEGFSVVLWAAEAVIRETKERRIEDRSVLRLR